MLISYNNKANLKNLDTFPILENFGNVIASPYNINILVNDHLSKKLINIEYFNEYAYLNNITDAGYAIAIICEAHNIQPDSIGFFIEDYKYLASDLIMETAIELLEKGYTIYQTNIPSSSFYYQALQEAFMKDQNYELEDSENLIAYCEDGNIFEHAGDKIGKGKDLLVNTTKSRYNKVKDNLSDVIAKKLSAAKKTAKELAAKASRVSGSTKAFFLRQLDKAKELVRYLENKLAKAKIGKKADSATNTFKRGTSYVGKKVSSGVDYAKDTGRRAYSGIKGKFS